MNGCKESGDFEGSKQVVEYGAVGAWFIRAIEGHFMPVMDAGGRLAKAGKGWQMS